jgi:site-specific recombinase XerD
VRHHLHEKVIQRAVAAAVHKAHLTQPASCHTLRHYFSPSTMSSVQPKPLNLRQAGRTYSI